MTIEDFYRAYANTPLGDRKKYIKYGHRNISLLHLYKMVERNSNIIRQKQTRNDNLIKMAEDFWNN